MDHSAILAAIAPGASMEDTVAAIKTYKFGESTGGLKAVEGLVTGSLGNSEARKAVSAALIGVLTSADATRDAKIFACRQLAMCGGAENVGALAPLLANIDTSDMARLALERIPGSDADAALVDALGKADDKSKIGIVNSLGARRAASAVPAIAPLVKAKDPLLAEAAAAALGHIGGADAVKALKGRVAKSARDTAKNSLLEIKERAKIA